MSTLKTNNIQHVDRSDPSIIISTDGGVSIAGTLTYEDVTNVDAVGIVTGRELINAQKQIHVGTGVSVKAGGLNVTAGITTVQALQATTGAFTGNLTITNTAPQISLVDSDNNSDFSIYGASGVFNIYDETNSASRLTIASDGVVTIAQGLLLSSTLTIPDSIIHSGDTNTKIRFPAADTITAETSGIERIRINSSGNFGVATASPAQKFHVYGNSGTTAIALGDNSTTQPYMLLEARETQNLCTVHSRTNNPLTFEINQSEYMRIKQNGHVGIGTDDPGQDLTIYADGPNFRMTHSGNTNQYNSAYVHVDETGMEFNSYQEGTGTRRPIIFKQYTDERARIDSSGRLLVGSTSSRTIANHAARIQLQGTDYQTSTLSITNNANAGNGAFIFFASQRSGSVGGSTIVQNNDSIGTLRFFAGDGTDINSYAAEIQVNIDGTPGSNDVPGRITFKTTADGAAGPTERMRIDATGNTHFGSGGTLNGSNTVSIVPSDGLINFGMDGRTEFVTSTNSCYIYSGEGSSGTTLAGDLILQSRSNQNRTIRFVTGSSPTQRAYVNEYGIGVSGAVSATPTSSSTRAASFNSWVVDNSQGGQSVGTVKINSQKGIALDCNRYYTSGDIAVFRINNDYEGAIYVSPSGVNYNTTSDYRLKENEVVISDGISRVKQLKPYKFNFKSQPSVTEEGFFAHEVQSVVPTAVVGEKDATMTTYYEEGDTIPDGKAIGDVKDANAVNPQTIDRAKLVPLLTAALQEEIAKREALEVRVAAIEKIAGI